MKPEETKVVEDAAELQIKMLGWEGRHLYGVGHWGRMDENYLYRVNQNGHDGDDWSRNNSNEGIVWRTPLTPEIRGIIGRMQEFEKN